MKGILKFELPEEQGEFRDASVAGKYYSALCDIRDLVQNVEKYPEDYPIYRILNSITKLIPGEIYE